MIWSRSEIRLARKVPLKPLLDGLGYQLDPRPNGNHAIARQTPEIVVKEHFWVCPDSGASGNAIDFLMRVRGLPFNDAMRLLKPLLRPEAS